MFVFQGSYKAFGCSGFAQDNPAATWIWEALSSSSGLQGTDKQNPFGLFFFHFFLSYYSISLYFFVRGWLPWTCPWTVMVQWPSMPPCSPWSELLWKLKLKVSMGVHTNTHTPSAYSSTLPLYLSYFTSLHHFSFQIKLHWNQPHTTIYCRLPCRIIICS